MNTTEFNNFVSFLQAPSAEGLEQIKENEFYKIAIDQIEEFKKFSPEDVYTYNLMFVLMEELHSMSISGIKIEFYGLNLSFLIMVDTLGLKNLLDYCYAIREVCNEINSLEVSNDTVHVKKQLEKVSLMTETLKQALKEYHEKCNHEANTIKFLMLTMSIALRNYLEDTIPPNIRINKFKDFVIMSEESSETFDVFRISELSQIDDVFKNIVNLKDGFGNEYVETTRLTIGVRQPLYLLTGAMIEKIKEMNV